MPKVFIPASLRPQADGTREIDLPGQTVRDLVVALEARYPLLIGRLREGDRLRPGLCVAINTKLSVRGLLEVVPLDGEVHFLPTIGGG